MKPVVLTILDGWGYSTQKIGNAILNARTPNFNYLLRNYPATLLQASGKAVGITWGESGNSEVGHLTIGAGRIIFQTLSRINKAIETGDFFSNPALTEVAEHVKQNNSKMHLVGLLTSGSVHAYFNHIVALLDFAEKNQLTDVRLHLFTDGRDSGTTESIKLISYLNEYLSKVTFAGIATIIGRDLAMNRSKNWETTKKAYDLLTGKLELEITNDPLSAIVAYHNSGITDPKIPPTVVNPDGFIQENDGIIFFNFREDSMRQIASAFTEEGFNEFAIEPFRNIKIASMTEYFESDKLSVAFPSPIIKNTLSEVLSSEGKKQIHIAETEKYAHVTFFLNGLRDEKFEGEKNVLIESYENDVENPQMRAPEITDAILDSLETDDPDFIVANFANADMLAHSGNYEATLRGVEAIDDAIGKIKDAILSKGGILIVTADHGHAESMVYKGSGTPKTKHEGSPVPFILVTGDNQREVTEAELNENLSEIRGLLSDIAPTVLDILGIKKPVEMTGNSLMSVFLDE